MAVKMATGLTMEKNSLLIPAFNAQVVWNLSTIISIFRFQYIIFQYNLLCFLLFKVDPAGTKNRLMAHHTKMMSEAVC